MNIPRMNRRYFRQQCRIENIASEGNLLNAAKIARRHKSRRPDVEDWWLCRETEITRLANELLSGKWEPGGYRFFEVYEPKRRTIAAAPFADRVVHHALCRILQPLLERRFIARSFSCQRGKGTTAARQCCRKLTNRYRYVLKCDIHKFFHQIDHAVLLEKLGREILCPGTMRLIGKIIASFETGPELTPVIFPQDDLFTPFERSRGLPIGNLTSQLWGNYFLDGLDHRITEDEAHGAYLRYTDDFLLFGDDKFRLWDLKQIIEEELNSIRLKFSNPKSRMMATREGVAFCGFRFIPGQQPRILGATKRRFEKRRHRHFRTGMEIADISLRVFCWYQFSREGNTEGLRQAYEHWPLDGKKRCRIATTG